jgi:hypothetical protein
MAVSDVQFDRANFCYNGNPKLKKAGVSIPFTQEQVAEYIKCRDDIVYFVKTYVYIVSLDRGMIPFSLYPYQEEMLRSFLENRFSINLLARQMGKTTTVAAYLLYEAIFNKNMRIAVLANKGDTAREILDRIKKMFEELPWFLKPGVQEWNKGSIELSNGSKIISAATSSSSIRGQSMNIIYLDELAFIQNDVEFFTSTYPVISAGKTTKVIITSTPNGMNLFYKLWSDAESGRNSFVPNKFLWWHHPERDETWKDETLKNISQKQFAQEFDCEFFGSSDTLISGSKLQQLAFVDPIRSDRIFNVYAEPEADKTYVATIDVAEGVGKDYSVINVFDISTQPYKQVAIYRNNIIPPIMLVDVAYKILRTYNDAFCVVESNSVGKIVADGLYYDLEYENMLTTRSKDGENIISGSGEVVGLRQTKKTKLIGCSALKTMIESDTLIIYDFMTIQELSTFIKRQNTYQAEEGKTDDIVMTLVMFCWFATQPYFEDLTDINVRNLIKNNYLKVEDNNHLIFGFYDNGIDDTQDDVIEDPSLLRR